MSARQPKLDWIQVLRAVAVLLVVAFHVGTVEAKYGGGAAVVPGWIEVGNAGVDLFFVISGFVMATLMRGKFASPGNALGFLMRRAERIYPPYWFYTGLVLAAWLARPGWVNQSQGGHIDFVSSFLLLPAPGLPALMVAWSLIFEMFFYAVMAAFLAALPERRFGAGLLLWAIATVAASLWVGDDAGPWAQVAANPMALEFILGAALALRFHAGHTVPIPFWAGAAALGAVCWLGALDAIPEADGMTGWWVRVVGYAPPAFLLLQAALHRERAGARPPQWLVAIGDASYSIYLSHLLVLNALGRVWAPFAAPGRWDNLLALPLLFAAVIAFGLASHRWLEVPVLGFFRRRRLRGPGD